MVVVDCGQKRQGLAHFRDKQGKNHGYRGANTRQDRGPKRGRVLINLRRRPVRPDTDRLCATAANVAMGQKATSLTRHNCRRRLRRLTA